MPKPFKPQVICANDLHSGAAIWLKSNTTWTEHLNQAIIAETVEQSERLLAVASSDIAVVGAYLAEVQIDEASGSPMPAHFREAFRTRGPSNYFHGKQAEV